MTCTEYGKDGRDYRGYEFKRTPFVIGGIKGVWAVKAPRWEDERVSTWIAIVWGQGSYADVERWIDADMLACRRKK